MRPVRTILTLWAALGAVVVLVVLVAVAASPSARACEGVGGPSAVAGVPSWLLPIYEQAAAKYGLGANGWAYLASINYHETSFGSDLSTSNTGALGWMQFEPGTWRTYGITPDGSRAPDSPAGWDNPADAIFSAANYLQISGAPSDWPGAIYAYNHAGWYAAEVTATARRYIAATPGLPHAGFASQTELPASGSCGTAAPGQYVNPFARSRGAYVTRLDMGADVAAQGPIDALGDATITYAATGIGGGWVCEGPYPNGGIVYRLNDGPDRGKLVYVAEDIVPTVHAPQTVTAGQQIATFAGSDCIETGWAAQASGVATYAAVSGGGYTDGAGCNPTAAGENFYDLLHSLGLSASSCRQMPPITGSHYP